MTLESFDAHVYTHLHIYLFINYPVIYQTILQWISIFNCSINIPYVWLQNISVIKSAVIFFSTLYVHLFASSQRLQHFFTLTSVCCVYTTMYSSSVGTALLTLHPTPHLPGNLIPIDCQTEEVWGYNHTVKRLGSEVRRFKLFSISHLYGGFVFIPGHWFVAGVHWVRGRQGDGR